MLPPAMQCPLSSARRSLVVASAVAVLTRQHCACADPSLLKCRWREVSRSMEFTGQIYLLEKDEEITPLEVKGHGPTTDAAADVE